eukprot:scaffold131592_cov60-Attheya_sp.AAC.3
MYCSAMTVGPLTRVTPFSESSTFRVWCTDPAYLQNSDPKPDAYGIIRCREEIESGRRYHAIVDYSNEDEFEAFDNDLGSHLVQFAAAGGVIAFPSSEGLLVSRLKQLFDVNWWVSSYFRTTWGPCKENEKAINYMIPDVAGRDVSPKSPDAEHDVNVAMHDYGKGTIAYFGDVHGEDQTLWLVSALVESRSPRSPIDCFTSLD